MKRKVAAAALELRETAAPPKKQKVRSAPAPRCPVYSASRPAERQRVPAPGAPLGCLAVRSTRRALRTGPTRACGPQFNVHGRRTKRLRRLSEPLAAQRSYNKQVARQHELEQDHQIAKQSNNIMDLSASCGPFRWFARQLRGRLGSNLCWPSCH